jgi:uncharacterized protein YecE (DUF72 family)
MSALRLGTCSWKYPSWAGLVYSAPRGINYLEEYARRYDTVEVDQWFWSLFEGSDPRLPSDDELASIARMTGDLLDADDDVYLSVDNHYEGSAPLTIDRILALLERKRTKGGS